jgi:iodotyrosine deiodinase
MPPGGDHVTEAKFVPVQDWYAPAEGSTQAARSFCDVMKRRRSVRMFSSKPVARETIEWLVRTAGSAPNGANKQPWRFVCVADPALKRAIREAAEAEEREFYQHRASERWLNDLARLGTDENKAYLEVVPWLIVVFRLVQTDEGGQVYYPQESVGIALGMLLAAAQFAGLATLVHTPSPMKFLAEALGRPDHERAFALIPVGYPADDLMVPAEALEKKPLDEIMVVHEGTEGAD